MAGQNSCENIGFRVCLKIVREDENIGECRKCYIYINLSSWTKVKDVEKHIRKLFQLQNVDLYVNNIYLPSEETILVLSPNDILKAVSKSCANSFESNLTNVNISESNQTVVKKSKKVKRLAKENEEDLVKHVYEELAEKRAEILSSSKVLSPELKNAQVDSDHPPNEESESIYDSSQVKVKRKRKRKRKSVIDFKPTIVSLNNPSQILELQNGRTNHIRFSDDDKSFSADEKIHKNNGENDGMDHFKDKEWMSHLMNLANQGTKNKFSRCEYNKSESLPCAESAPIGLGQINGIETNESKNLTLETLNHLDYPVIENTKENDILLFKKLKLDDHYCPIISENILGKVKAVEEGPKVVIFEILDGLNELILPDGKFSLERQEDEKTDNIFRFNWEEVIEPRLVSC